MVWIINRPLIYQHKSKLADDEIKEYNALVQEVLTVINKYPDVYGGEINQHNQTIWLRNL